MTNFSDWGSGIAGNFTVTRCSDLSCFVEYHASLIVWKVWTPGLLLLGGFANIATIFVMRRIKDHNSSQHVFLIALAVSDFSLLYTGALREWVRRGFGVDVRLLHAAVCKVHKWLVYAINTTSAWLVTSVTVQRTMAVLWPHRMRMVCTVRRTWIVIAALVITAFAINFHLALGMGISATSNRCDTGPTGAYKYFYKHIFTWMDMCASSLLPCVILFVCDVILSFTLFKATSSISFVAAAVPPRAVSGTNDSSMHHGDNRRRKTASRTTIMILTLSCTFFLLTMPVCIFLIWYRLAFPFLEEDPEASATVELVTAVTYLLWYTNSSINFFLYCMTGTKFRKEFLGWVNCGAVSDAAGSSAVVVTAAGSKQQDSTQLSSLPS
ncbi:putative G-protein coupled receptor 139 [Babylonia areolata]|uniref:putative G-protein coupled receptor 139 n=1 Tax=Babylonia areolata TaxID=304850 RepID=UPI003FD31C06